MSTKLNGSKYCYVSITIQYQSFVYTQLNDQTVPFQSIQFNKIICLNVQELYLTQRSGVANPGQSKPRAIANTRIFDIPQSCSITGASPSDCFSVISRRLVGGVQSVYSTAPAYWAIMIQIYLSNNTFISTNFNENLFYTKCNSLQKGGINFFKQKKKKKKKKKSGGGNLLTTPVNTTSRKSLYGKFLL